MSESGSSMDTALAMHAHSVGEIPLQDASRDIWDTKYRLRQKNGEPVDVDLQASYERVARALADVEREEAREHWYERFVHALQKVRFRPDASCRMPVPVHTNPQPQRSTAPYQVRSRFDARYSRQSA